MYVQHEALNLGVKVSWVVCVTIKMEKNVGEGEQKLHSCFRKDLGPLTVQLVSKESFVKCIRNKAFLCFNFQETIKNTTLHH